MLFGAAELADVLHAPHGDVATAELVLAYLRHTPEHADTCLRCLVQLPVLPHRVEQVVAACGAPMTANKLRCLQRYLVHVEPPKQLLDDMVYAMRFSPHLAPLVLELLPLMGAEDDICTIDTLTLCLYDAEQELRLGAMQALRQLCTRQYLAMHYVLPHCGAVMADPLFAAEHARFLLHLAQLVPVASAQLVDALPLVVANGPSCADSVDLVQLLARDHPRAVARQGGLAMLLCAAVRVPCEITECYLQAEDHAEDDDALAYMHCRCELPSNAQRAMRRAFQCQPAPVRALYAAAYLGARLGSPRPPAPELPDFDVTHAGTVEMVDSAGQTCTGLLAPLARAAEFIAAHARHEHALPLQVPLDGRLVLRALCYDELPEDTASLTALAELGNMWCAPRLVYHCIHQLVQRVSFWLLMDLAGQWTQARSLMRYYALKRLTTLARHERAPELAEMLWGR